MSTISRVVFVIVPSALRLRHRQREADPERARVGHRQRRGVGLVAGHRRLARRAGRRLAHDPRARQALDAVLDAVEVAREPVVDEHVRRRAAVAALVEVEHVRHAAPLERVVELRRVLGHHVEVVVAVGEQRGGLGRSRRPSCSCAPARRRCGCPSRDPGASRGSRSPAGRSCAGPPRRRASTPGRRARRDPRPGSRCCCPWGWTTSAAPAPCRWRGSSRTSPRSPRSARSPRGPRRRSSRRPPGSSRCTTCPACRPCRWSTSRTPACRRCASCTPARGRRASRSRPWRRASRSSRRTSGSRPSGRYPVTPRARPRIRVAPTSTRTSC